MVLATFYLQLSSLVHGKVCLLFPDTIEYNWSTFNWSIFAIK